MLFTDRHEAGQRLAERLAHLKDQNPVVLALPRGGVPVGFEIAAALRAPLDLILVRKIGAPDNEEFAVGAVADGDQPELVVDERIVKELALSAAWLEEAKSIALKEIERRRRIYLGDRLPEKLAGRTAIVVDDGIATGATMRAALHGARRGNPAKLVLAVPVASPRALRLLGKEADEIVCLDSATPFFAVGQFYRRFPQLSDGEVTALLEQAKAWIATS